MKKRIITIIAVLLVFTFVLSACGKKDRKESEVESNNSGISNQTEKVTEKEKKSEMYIEKKDNEIIVRGLDLSYTPLKGFSILSDEEYKAQMGSAADLLDTELPENAVDAKKGAMIANMSTGSNVIFIIEKNPLAVPLYYKAVKAQVEKNGDYRLSELEKTTVLGLEAYVYTTEYTEPTTKVVIEQTAYLFKQGSSILQISFTPMGETFEELSSTLKKIEQ